LQWLTSLEVVMYILLSVYIFSRLSSLALDCLRILEIACR
jgi:hypothetical protein